MSKIGSLLLVVLLVGCAARPVETVGKRGSQQQRIAAWNRVASEYIHMGKYEEAKRPLKQALAIDPKASDSLNLLAFVFQNQGEIEVADKYYKQSLASDPGSAQTHNNYGIFLLLQKRYDEACSQLEEASQDPLYDQRTQSLANLANCYRLGDNLSQAEETFQKVLRLDPNNSTAILELAAMALDRGDSGRSWQLFSRFSELVNLRRVEHNPQSLWLGIRLSREGRDPSMAATYALLLKNLFPDSREYQLYKESR